MITIRNPARSRPLSRNVLRLMKASRTDPQNPNIVRVGHILTVKDLAYCDLQGDIFMTAVDRGLPMSKFAPLFMRSQLSSVIDFSFFHPGEQYKDTAIEYLQLPILLKSPDVIVDTLLWIEDIIIKLEEEKKNDPRAALVEKLVDDSTDPSEPETIYIDTDNGTTDIDALTVEYAYAYWLGYIYRYESLLHEEASRMVYAVLDETFMREVYETLDFHDMDIQDCAAEICHRLDLMIVEKIS